MVADFSRDINNESAEIGGLDDILEPSAESYSAGE
jgi:hypothetical protein